MVLRKLLVLGLVLLVSLMVAVSAFGQTTTNQEGSSGEVSATENSSGGSSQEESSGDSPTSPPQEEPPSVSPTDWNSLFGSAQLSDVCPAVLNTAVVDRFRASAPTLVEACENASQGTAPTGQDAVVPPDQGTTVPPSGSDTSTADEQGSTAPVA